MLGILSWIITGLIVGALARLILPGRQPIGLLLTIVLGIVGAFVGGLMSSLLFGVPVATDPNVPADASTMWPGWIMSVIGAIIVLWGYMSLTARRDPVLR